MPSIGDKAQTLATEAELRRLAQRGIGSKAKRPSRSRKGIVPRQIESVEDQIIGELRPFRSDTVEPTEPSPVQAPETGTCAACGTVTTNRVYTAGGERTRLFACGYHGGRP